MYEYDISYKIDTLNGSTDHDMVTIWNREGCFYWTRLCWIFNKW